ncbi:amidohydrolase family protein [Pilimelia columellifera]|uniref:Amidohydrolase family protein n=1 Tax=Pilimelia columellifera subsp. columellifera TaxID=706583 RepID=A0ABN3N3Q2_9ACTN
MTLHVRGVVLPDDEVRDLWLTEDTVSFAPLPGARTLSTEGFILPGLVDAHCHIGIAYGARPVASVDEARQLATIDRDAGVLAIRDAGSPLPYPELDDEPGMPRLARAGRHVAPPRRYLRDIGVEVVAEDVADEVVNQARAGNGWVKLVGDWIDRGVGDLAPAWEADTLRAAVAAAHAVGARITAHTFSEEAVEILVRGRIDSIEHGTGLSLDLIDTMARNGTALVPTMINIATFDEIADHAAPKFPGYAAHMRALKARFPQVVGAAHEAGVPVFVGTDAGGGIRHGLAAEEMLLLHEQAGMPVEAVLRAASWGAREWLGFPGLVHGGWPDLVVYDADPRVDLRVVRAPRHIVLRGRVIDPARP